MPLLCRVSQLDRDILALYRNPLVYHLCGNRQFRIQWYRIHSNEFDELTTSTFVSNHVKSVFVLHQQHGERRITKARSAVEYRVENRLIVGR